MYLCLFESEFICNYFRQVLISCFLIPTKYILMITPLFPVENNADAFNPLKRNIILEGVRVELHSHQEACMGPILVRSKEILRNSAGSVRFCCSLWILHSQPFLQSKRQEL